MSAIDALNAATHAYIARSAPKLVDNIFQSNPLLSALSAARRFDTFRDEIIAATGCSLAEATVTASTVDAFTNDDP
jgi:hypothetical protein